MSGPPDEEPDCPDCGLPHPSTNPYCFCRRTPDPLLDASLRMREATMPDARGMVPVRKGDAG